MLASQGASAPQQRDSVASCTQAAWRTRAAWASATARAPCRCRRPRPARRWCWSQCRWDGSHSCSWPYWHARHAPWRRCRGRAGARARAGVGAGLVLDKRDLGAALHRQPRRSRGRLTLQFETRFRVPGYDNACDLEHCALAVMSFLFSNMNRVLVVRKHFVVLRVVALGAFGTGSARSCTS